MTEKFILQTNSGLALRAVTWLAVCALLSPYPAIAVTVELASPMGLSAVLREAVTQHLNMQDQQGAIDRPQVQSSPITTLIEQALANHPSVQNQALLVNAAKAGVDSANWQVFPTPAVSIQQAGTNSSDTGYQGDSRASNLSLTQPLWTWGRLDAGKDKAKAQALAALAGYEEAKLQIAVRVVQSYGDWFAAYNKRAAYEKGVELHERLQEQATRRVDAGQAAPIDLAFAQGRLATMLAEMVTTQTQEQIGLARLSQLVGQTVYLPALTKSPPQSISLTALPAQLLSQADATSPTLARYRAQAQIQLAMMQEQKASALPEVSLRLERQYGNLGYLGSKPQNRVFIGVSSNFGAGLSRQSALVEASNRHAAALIDVQTQQRAIAEQILADHALLVNADARRLALQQAADLSDQVLSSSDRQYLTGRKTWQDLMNLAREQVQAKLQLADMQALQLVASWRIALLTAGLTGTLGQSQPTPTPTPTP